MTVGLSPPIPGQLPLPPPLSILHDRPDRPLYRALSSRHGSMTPVAFARPFAYRARPYDSRVRVHAARTRARESAGRSRRYIKKIISSERRLADRRIFQPGGGEAESARRRKFLLGSSLSALIHRPMPRRASLKVQRSLPA